MKTIQTTEELIDSLAAIAKKRKITQQEIANRTGIAQPHISRLFSRKNPELKTLVKVAGCMGVRIHLKTR